MPEACIDQGTLRVSGAGAVIANSGAFAAVTRTGAGVYTIAPALNLQFSAADIAEITVEGTTAGEIVLERATAILWRVRTFTGQAVANDRPWNLHWARTPTGS